jgi:hypothetical protein
MVAKQRMPGPDFIDRQTLMNRAIGANPSTNSDCAVIFHAFESEQRITIEAFQTAFGINVT